MLFATKTQSNSTSKDAMTVAPCSCTAENETDVDFFSGIALAMSVLLCIVLSLIGTINIASGIIILSILLIVSSKAYKEKAVFDRV